MGMNAIKITAVLSAAALSLCLMTECKVQAKNIVDNGDFKYVISDDGKSAEIISYVGQSLYVSVPDEVNNCAVVSIGAAAFKDNQKLKELEISGSIKSIDTAAFSGCSCNCRSPDYSVRDCMKLITEAMCISGKSRHICIQHPPEILLLFKCRPFRGDKRRKAGRPSGSGAENRLPGAP